MIVIRWQRLGAALLAAALLALGACGKKGPLYLPDNRTTGSVASGVSDGR